MCKRIYVKVVAEFSPEGKIKPVSVEWEDGRCFQVDRLLDVRRAASTKAGGTGMRYTVRILGRETYLFEDQGRWFVEAKN